MANANTPPRSSLQADLYRARAIERRIVQAVVSAFLLEILAIFLGGHASTKLNESCTGISLPAYVALPATLGVLPVIWVLVLRLRSRKLWASVAAAGIAGGVILMGGTACLLAVFCITF